MGEALTSLFSGIGGSLSSLFGGGSSSTGGSNEPSGRADPYEGFTAAQRRLLGVAALQDAFASLAGQQGTALQRIAPVAEQVGWNEYVRNLAGAQPPAMPRAMAQAPQAAAPQAAPAAPQPAPTEGGFSRAAIGSALDRLARAESNSPTAVNRFGYAGQYQLGAPLAASAGIYRPGEGEINQQGRWSGQWGGTFNIPGFENVRTLQDFLANPDAQRRAAELSMNYQAGQLSQMGLLQNVGQEINGVRITPEALLQGAWLGGPRGVERFVRGGGQDRQDAFGTPVSRWMSLGQGEAPAAAAPAVGAAPGGAQAAAQPSPLTPQQAVLAGGAPGQPRITPEVAALLRQLGPQAGRQFLAQMQMRAMQQETRVLQPQEAQAILGEAYDPGRRYQVTAQGGVQPIAGTREGPELSREQQRSEENTLRASFLSQQPVKDYLAMSSQVRSVRDAATRENPSRYNDINLVYAYAKMLDPNSVVRETEYGMVIEAGGVEQRVFRWGSVINGQSAFNDRTRREILREAEGRYNSTREAYDVQADAFRELARTAGVRPEMVIPPVPRMPSAQERSQNRPQLAEGARQGAINYLRSEVQSGRMSEQQAIQEARNSGIPNAERLFQ